MPAVAKVNPFQLYGNWLGQMLKLFVEAVFAFKIIVIALLVAVVILLQAAFTVITQVIVFPFDKDEFE